MAANKLDSSMLEDDAVTGAKLNPALVQGDIIYADGTDTIDRLAKGTASQVLTMNAGATAPEWAAAAGGDKRNFIIDGDFTQWPEGTAATAIPTYGYGTSALMKGLVVTSGTITGERSTNVPTVGESGHQSAYSYLYKCTVADSSIDAGDIIANRYSVTGSDFASLYGQEVTISFWAKTAANNSGDTYSISINNSAANRAYVYNFTPTSSWTQFTHTLTMEATGSWGFTEADTGMRIHTCLAVGSTNQGTAETWEAAQDFGTSSTSNFMASTSNEFYMSQFGLYLGSTAPTFTSPSIATVKSQVDYYVENISGYIGSGWANTSNAGMGVCHWATKRKAPTVTYIDQTSFYIETSTSGGNVTTMGMYLAQERAGRWSWARSGASHTVGSGAVARADGTGRLLVDARH